MTRRPEAWAKGAIPESWLCIDCGFNTAPGCSTRVEIEKHLERHTGFQQTFNSESEIYTVFGHVWARAGMEAWGGCLCIGCLEKRIGRQLIPDDFIPDHPFNSAHLPGTRRLLQRRMGKEFWGAMLGFGHDVYPDPPRGKVDQLLDSIDWRSVCARRAQ